MRLTSVKPLLFIAALALTACSPAATPAPTAGATATVPAATATVASATATSVPPSPAPTASAVPATLPPTDDAAAQPGPRAGADMVYHAGLEMVVMLNGSPDDNQLWGWDGDSWQVVAAGGPSARELGGMAFDAQRGVLVVYGGRTNRGTQCLYDTWEWDGQAWQQFEVDSPAVCSHFVMEYVPALEQVVVFGGADDQLNPGTEMWTWDGQAWATLASEPPEARFHAMSAVDPAHNQLLLLGGFDINNQMVDEFWAWDTSTWEQLALPGPPALSHGRLVFDTTRTQLLLYGGTTRARRPFALSADTWRLSDGAWQLLDSPGPSARGATAMAYDPVRDRVVLYGGFDNDQPGLSDTWDWDGESWTCRARCD